MNKCILGNKKGHHGTSGNKKVVELIFKKRNKSFYIKRNKIVIYSGTKSTTHRKKSTKGTYKGKKPKKKEFKKE
jgi:hypothetical protein